MPVFAETLKSPSAVASAFAFFKQMFLEYLAIDIDIDVMGTQHDHVYFSKECGSEVGLSCQNNKHIINFVAFFSIRFMKYFSCVIRRYS
jgi:hypothetical protein